MSEIKYNKEDFSGVFIPLTLNKSKVKLSTLSTEINDSSEALNKFEELYESFRSILTTYRELLEKDLNAINESVQDMAEEDSILEKLFRSMEIK